MIELYPTKHKSILKGDFPLNHDCILKAHFLNDTGLRFQYFTCRSQDSGIIVDLFNKLYCVRKVEIISVDVYGL